MKQIFDSHDIEHFKHLMDDFPASSNVHMGISAALSLVHGRYESLNAEKIIPHLGRLTDDDFQRLFVNLSQNLHKYLFLNIFFNAGQYRKDTDPDNGIIYFGPNQVYKGLPGPEIPGGVKGACSNLLKTDSNPCYSMTKFYQQFVLVHPFYDANGRIGRFMADIYLNFHGLTLVWEKLHRNARWLKKLNDCHKRLQSREYERYVEILARHFEKCTIKIVEPDEANLSR